MGCFVAVEIAFIVGLILVAYGGYRFILWAFEDIVDFLLFDDVDKMNKVLKKESED